MTQQISTPTTSEPPRPTVARPPRRKFLPLAFGAAFIVTATALISSGPIAVTRINQTELQTKLAPHVGENLKIPTILEPIVHDAALTAAEIAISDGAIDVDATIVANLRGGKPATITIHAAGKPEFRDGELFFKPDKIDVADITYSGDAPRDAIANLASKYVKSETLRHAIENHADKANDWSQKLASLSIDHALKHVPIYRPKGVIVATAVSLGQLSTSIEGEVIVVSANLKGVGESLFATGVLVGLLMLI
jgi:hypothetical protein